MGYTAIQYDGCINTVFNRVGGGFQFRDHAVLCRAIADQRARARLRQARDNFAFGVQHALHIRQH